MSGVGGTIYTNEPVVGGGGRSLEGFEQNFILDKNKLYLPGQF